MSSSALESQGMLLKIGDAASPEGFTAISEITNIDGPGGSATVIGVSDLDSTAREKRLGLNDEGQISATINYIPSDTQHAALRTARANRTLTNFQMVFTDSPVTTWSFAAYVNGFTVSNSVDGVTESNVTLEISGSIEES